MKWLTPALLVLATVVGLGGGLYYTWVLDPVEIDDTVPAALRTEDKILYLAIIGDLYVYEGDLALAKIRIGELNIEADGQVLAGLIDQYLASGGRPEEARNLARLAEALGARGGILLVFASAPTPSPEWTPTSPILPENSPTPAPTATPAPTFQLIEQTTVCAEPGRPGRIEVRVQDAEGGDLGGMEILVSWNTGQDRFYTGLRPEWGMGYADFEMVPQVEYEVSMAGFQGDVAQGLTSDLAPGVCPGGALTADWRLTFQQMQ
jgi:hypothetical protein